MVVDYLICDGVVVIMFNNLFVNGFGLLIC